jgi:hypothetical protein
MRTFALLAILATPVLVCISAVANMPGLWGFLVAVGASAVMMREAVLICLMMMRHWRMFGRDYFLIEENGRERWVDWGELRSLPRSCEVRRREFRLHLFDERGRERD